jgi:uncharacterized protein
MRVPFPPIRKQSPVTEEPHEPVPIPHRELSTDTLRSLLEAFVLREGTDYGEHEATLDEKVADVLRQLERGEAQVFFDPNTESVDIVRTLA